MRSLFVVVALVSLPVVAKVNATACFVVVDNHPEAYREARAVFIGEVIKIEPFNAEVRGPMEIRRYSVTFKVEYSWKGAGFQEIGLPKLVVISEQVIKTAPGFYDCYPSVSFTESKKYLVYANETEGNNLLVGIANRTMPLWKASEDLKELKKRDALFTRVKPRLSLDDF